jgi:hypothetical protein
VLTVIRDTERSNLSNYINQWDVFIWSRNKFIHLISPWVIKKIFEVHKKNKNVTLYCHTLWAWVYGILCKKLRWINYHFDNHNVEYLRFQRTKKRYWPIIKKLEKRIIVHSQSTSVVSENDKKFIISHLVNTDNIEVIENMVEINHEKLKNKKSIRNKMRDQYKIAQETFLLLFFWSFHYQPNVEALKIIQETIIPWLQEWNCNFKCIVCGKWLEDYRDDNTDIIYAWFVDDIVDYILSSDMLIAPLLSGSWTKLKILESLEYWLPVITTTVWAEWIEDNWLLHIDEINNFNNYIKKFGNI